MSRNGKSDQQGNGKDDIAAAYNRFKEFEGRRYTGMKIGARHRWYYDKGEWTERKITPDEWEVSYAVTKRRKGRAPEGSGVPVGTEYHWYLFAHQYVTKLNANDYSTSLTGIKFKLAHKRAGQDKWSASDRAQRKHLIKFMENMLQELRHQAEEEQGKPVKKAPPRESSAYKAAAARARTRRLRPTAVRK